jgi:hypothetical protein
MIAGCRKLPVTAEPANSFGGPRGATVPTYRRWTTKRVAGRVRHTERAVRRVEPKLADVKRPPYHVTQMLTFVEAPKFTELMTELWSDAEFAAFQQFLARRPESGDVIPGLGGLRKVRWAAKGQGKRSGARVIYLHLPRTGMIYLFYVSSPA